MAVFKGFSRRKHSENRQAVRRKSSKMPWYVRPGSYLYRRLPAGVGGIIFHTAGRYFIRRNYETDEETAKRCRRFIEEEFSLLFWGILIFLLAAAGLLAGRHFSEHRIVIKRNPFGRGSLQQELVIRDKEGSTAAQVTIEEQELSPEGRKVLFADFFKDLEKNMRAGNRSLQKVNKPLRFDDMLTGYPFDVEYQPEDYSLIRADGIPGDRAKALRGTGTIVTKIKVTASYRTWSESRTYKVRLIPAEDRTGISPYDKVLAELRRIERRDPGNDVVSFPEELEGAVICLPGSMGYVRGLILLAFFLPLLPVLRRYYKLKAAGEKLLKEEEEDFPVIVHQMVLFLTAGLSVSSAIHRITGYYLETRQTDGPRQAFENLLYLGRQLEMGTSQREVCMTWGRRSASPQYQKLSIALTQILVKGSKEGEQILSALEKEAFQQRMDRAKKAGKTAETKLLFPMVVLLCLVMFLVMFPAVLRFQGF
ncbi:MAG: type II secretion system F family protein [Eubacterium sp.]|nr:type II secretion system F family protein [Eubacterium sp.]